MNSLKHTWLLFYQAPDWWKISWFCIWHLHLCVHALFYQYGMKFILYCCAALRTTAIVEECGCCDAFLLTWSCHCRWLIFVSKCPSCLQFVICTTVLWLVCFAITMPKLTNVSSANVRALSSLFIILDMHHYRYNTGMFDISALGRVNFAAWSFEFVQ